MPVDGARPARAQRSLVRTAPARSEQPRSKNPVVPVDGARLSSGRYDAAVGQPADFEARLAALERRVEGIASDAAAARHLAAARDRDLADIGVKVDANRAAINPLGIQSAGRFDGLENEMRSGFAEMRARLDQTAAGQEHIVELLNRLITDDNAH